MRRIVLSSFVVLSAVAVTAGPAVASHSPCDPSGPMCLRVDCPPPSTGNGWIWLDHHGFPRVDFTDCAAT